MSTICTILACSDQGAGLRLSRTRRVRPVYPGIFTFDLCRLCLLRKAYDSGRLESFCYSPVVCACLTAGASYALGEGTMRVFVYVQLYILPFSPLDIGFKL